MMATKGLSEGRPQPSMAMLLHLGLLSEFGSPEADWETRTWCRSLIKELMLGSRGRSRERDRKGVKLVKWAPRAPSPLGLL